VRPANGKSTRMLKKLAEVDVIRAVATVYFQPFAITFRARVPRS
jgi:hypothetical protein